MIAVIGTVILSSAHQRVASQFFTDEHLLCTKFTVPLYCHFQQLRPYLIHAFSEILFDSLHLQFPGHSEYLRMPTMQCSDGGSNANPKTGIVDCDTNYDLTTSWSVQTGDE